MVIVVVLPVLDMIAIAIVVETRRKSFFIVFADVQIAPYNIIVCQR